MWSAESRSICPLVIQQLSIGRVTPERLGNLRHVLWF